MSTAGVPTINPIFGQIVSASQIEDAMLTTLEKWFPTYLAEQERQLGMRANTLAYPQNYINRNAFDTLEGEQLPKVVVICEGLISPPLMSGQGAYRATWRVGVGVATAAKTEDVANRMVKAYGAAVRALVIQNPTLDSSLTISGVKWIEETYPNINIPVPLMLFKSANLYFAIDVDDVVTRYGGPDAPTIIAPAPYPEVKTVTIELDQIQNN